MAATHREDHAHGDTLAEALAALRTGPPRPLANRVVTRWIRLPGPVGDVFVSFTDSGVRSLQLAGTVASAEAFRAEQRARFGQPVVQAGQPPPGLATALRTGRSGGLRIDLRLLTDFERDVLLAVRRIPYGEVRPYGWVAHEIGRVRAVRAVGTALHRNPVPLLIPCHRVIKADGDLGQYVFGTPAKEALLQAEGVDVGELRELATGRVRYLGSDTTRIVCYPTCHHARRITQPHRKRFGSMRDATANGYRPCRDCRPVVT